MTFFTFDEDEVEPDTRDVLAASAILEITEFRLFELAYERWHGEPATERCLERFYTPYMFQHRAPPWVRQFCRDVLGRERLGTLDPREFGVFPVLVNDSMVRQGLRYALVVAVVLGTLHMIAILVAAY